MSEVYLMHLLAPVCAHRPARHYLGFSQNTVERERQYRRGCVGYHGRLMLAAHERGIDFIVARVWKNCTKRDEKLLRDLHNNPALCPICNSKLQLTTKLVAGRYRTYRLSDPRTPRYGDLDSLRDRELRPARRRIRNDGTLNFDPALDTDWQAELDAARAIAPSVPFDCGEPSMSRPIATVLISGELHTFVGAWRVVPDSDHAPYGFDADIPI